MGECMTVTKNEYPWPMFAKEQPCKERNEEGRSVMFRTYVVGWLRLPKSCPLVLP